MFGLLRERDVFLTILTEWLDLKDVVQFDTACTNHKARASVLSMLSLFSIPFPFENNSDLYWKHHESILYWLVQRQINPHGVLKVSERVWNMLFTGLNLGSSLVSQDSTISFVHLIQRLKLTHFLKNPLSFQHFEFCVNLQELTISHLPPISAASLRKGILPNLRVIQLEYCHINGPLIEFLAECQRIETLSLLRPTIIPNCLLSIGPELLKRLQRLTVRGNIFSFFQEFGLNQLLNNPPLLAHFQLRAITLDDFMNASEPFDAPLLFLISKSPQLRNLTLARTEIKILPLLASIRQFQKIFDCLHIDQCRLVQADLTPYELLCSQDIFPCKSFYFTSIVEWNDALFQEMIRLLGRNFLQSFTLAFCSMVSTETLQLINQTFPSLQSFQYEDEADYLTPYRVETVKELFQHVSRVLVRQWDEWQSTREREFGSPSQTLYEKDSKS